VAVVAAGVEAVAVEPEARPVAPSAPHAPSATATRTAITARERVMGREHASGTAQARPNVRFLAFLGVKPRVART
jgi:hypothetical protein